MHFLGEVPRMDTLALISGIASLIGLVLQFKDAFPEHRDIRRTTVVLLLGVFFGTLLASLFSFKATSPVPVTTVGITIGVFLIIVCFLVVFACFATDAIKRNELFTGACLSGIAVLVILLFQALSQRPVNNCNLTQFFYDDEIFKMADEQASRGNFQRAIDLLASTLPTKLPLINERDPRTEVIEKKIGDMRSRQLKAR